MKLIPVKDYEEMSRLGAEEIIGLVKTNPKAVLGLATGSTPTRLYQHLIEDHERNHTSYKDVTTFNLDEYIGLDASHPQSYRSFMNHVLFRHIDIPLEQTFIPNGMAKDLEEECKRYDSLIKEKGGIDLQILGIGVNGHIAFNEPGTPFESRTHIIPLTESTRVANSRFFNSMDEVPTHAITMGIGTILESKEIILLISGKSKQEAMRRLLSEGQTTDFPASALKNHPNVIIFADQEALEGTGFEGSEPIEI